MIDLSALEVWFITGSQHLYGPKTLEQVAADSQAIVEGPERQGQISRSSSSSSRWSPRRRRSPPRLRDADAAPNCIGIVAWMHTFSPSKMWIGGLTRLKKPMLHLDTQFNRDIPWASIDMDFMNLNQSAHGDREFGFICSRLRINRKVVVGHWQEKRVHDADRRCGRAPPPPGTICST